MPYRIATEEDKKRLGIYEDYDAIVDEDGNSHVLTEPEDRTWFRDMKPVMEELNELLRARDTALTKLDQLRKVVGEMRDAIQTLLDMANRHDCGECGGFLSSELDFVETAEKSLLLKAEALR